MQQVLRIVTALAVGVPLWAQSPLTTWFSSTNGGAIGGAVYFDLDVLHPTGITLLQIDLNTGNNAIAGTLDVYTVPGTSIGNMGNQSAWTGPGVSGSTLVTQPIDTPSPCVLNSPMFLPAGQYGVALVAGGYGHRYSGGSVNNQWQTVELRLTAGHADNVPFSGGTFTPRVANLNIHYTNGPIGTVFATNTKYGAGCIDRPDATFYENFAPGTFDLLGPAPSPDSMTLIRTGDTYVAVSGQATYQPAVSAAWLGLGDDAETFVPLSMPMPVGRFGSTSLLSVCSNGFISAGFGNGTSPSPSLVAMLSNPVTAWYSWHDFHPGAPGGGYVKFEERYGIAYVTWDGVFDAGLTTPNTVQFQFDLVTGNVSIIWLGVSNLGNGHLVGFAEGGVTADPGSSDLSVLLPNSMPQAAIFQVDPLQLDADARPIINTQINLRSSNITPTALLGGVTVGFNELVPSLPLAYLGMPSCWQHSDQLLSLLFFPAGASTAAVPMTVPNLVSLDLYAQSFLYDPAAGLTTLGAVSSNAVHLMTGDW